MKKLKKIFIILILIFLLAPCVPNFAVNQEVSEETSSKLTETHIGIGGGGALFVPAISPFDEKLIMVAADMGGLYISSDAGSNWDRKNLHGTVMSTCFDPNRENVLYAGGSGLYRSTDRGENFELIFPNEDDIIARMLHNENGLQYIFTKSKTYTTSKLVKDILVNPENSDNIFVLMYYYNYGSVFESKDNGETFTELFTVTQTQTDKNIFYELAKLVYKAETDELYCVTDEEVLKYDREEKKANSIYQSDLGIVNIKEVYENNETTFIVIENTDNNEKTETKIYFTKDFANNEDITWKFLDGLPNSFENNTSGTVQFKWKFNHLDATSLDNIYVSHGTQVSNYKWSIDAIIRFNGENSKILYGNPFRNHVVIQNKGWNDGCTLSYGLATSKANPNMYLQTTLTGVNYSPNGEDIYQCSTKSITDENGNKTYVTTGINEQTTYGVEIDPFNENNMLLLNTDLGLIRSENAGASWVQCITSIKSTWQNTIYDAEFDTRKKDVVYSIWGGRHDAPYYPGNEKENSNVHGGFAISFDGGKTWDCDYSTGIPENTTPVKMGIVYPESQDGDVTIYVATFKDGFFVSYDSGKTFQEINEGIEKVKYNNDDNYQYIFGEDIEVKDGRVFALTAQSSFNKDIQAGELFELKDDKWEKIDLNSSEAGKNVINPRDIYYHDGTLYITSTCKSIYTYKNGVDFENHGGGIITYKDGEISQIFDDSISTTGVQIDTEGNLYVSDIEGNIYRKAKDSSEYEKIYADYHYISKGIQLFDDDVIYLSTSGGGVLKLEGLKNLEETSILKGDIDGDGVPMTINDIAKLKLHLIDIQTLTADYLEIADLDNNGCIDINDLAKMKLECIK